MGLTLLVDAHIQNIILATVLKDHAHAPLPTAVPQ